MEISLRYYEAIKQETSIEKEGQVLIDSGAIPVKFNIRKYTPRDSKQQRYYGYFKSDGKWTVRLHLEREEVLMLIRKLEESVKE